MKKYFYLILVLFLLVWMAGCEGPFEGPFEEPIPLITSVYPASASRYQVLEVTLTGVNFEDVTDVYFGPGTSVQVYSFEVVSSNEIQVLINAGARLGPKNVYLVNPYYTVYKPNSFTVVGMPDITSVSPATGVQGGLADVTILGEGFYDVTGISFGSGITVEDYEITSEYEPVMIIATISIDATATVGVRNVAVSTTHGTATGSGLFTVTAATSGLVVNSVTPNAWTIGSTLTVSIKGSNFSESPTPIVSFGSGITVNWVTRINSNEIEANITINGEPVGYIDVSVTIGSLTGVGEDLFYVSYFY